MRARHSIVALLVAVAWLALAGQAAAKVIHKREGSFALHNINFLAVDNSAGLDAGDLYIGETEEGSSESRVYQASPAGAATGVALDGAATPAGSFGFIDFANLRIADGPAVDGSSGTRAGDIYVPDVVHGVVDVFDRTGAYVCQITGSATPSASECASLTGSETPLGGLQPLSVAVDPASGTVAVGDARGVVYEFDENGEFAGEIADPHVTLPGSLAFDSHGSLYVVNESVFSGAGEAVKFSAGGSFVGVVDAGRNSVAVDLGDDHVYLGALSGSTREFDPTGSLVSSFGENDFSLDVNRADGKVYAAPIFAEGEIWSGDLVIPTVVTGAASAVSQASATLSGSVDPEIAKGGTSVASCEFEFGEDETYGQSVSCSPAAPYSSPTDVSAALGGLNPSTTYDYRLVAVNSEGYEAKGENRTFTTAGPAGVGGETTIARTTSATVSAEINPFGFETTCEVQYVDDAAFQSSGYAGATTAPCPEPLAAGFGNRTVSLRLAGLKIGTVYHFRFVTHSQGGAGIGEDATFSTFGIESFSVETLDESGQPYTQAGGHPFAMKVVIGLTTTAPLTNHYTKSASANLRTVQVDLPPGLIGDPTATPRCEAALMKPNRCPGSTQVGLGTVFSPRGSSEFGPIYNLAPPTGIAAELGARFNVFGAARIEAGLRTGADYGVTAKSIYVTADEAVERIEMTLWGVPAAAAHFSERFCQGQGLPECSSDAPPVPFLTNPTSCQGPLEATLRVDAWQDPGNFVSAQAPIPAQTGCGGLDFKPSIQVRPEVRSYESPTGLHVDLHVPQNRNPLGTAEANLKDATVSLPTGVAVNPAGANGLASCSPAEIDLHGPNPAACPAAAKLGSVEVNTPLLDHPLPGAVYVATPHDNPFGSLLAIYVAVDDPQSGVVVKLAGKVTPDPQSGRLTASFDENPQLPFEDFKLDFFGGPAASLTTPQACGDYTTTTAMAPWSENGDADPRDTMRIDSGPNGLPCVADPAQAPNTPSFSAGAVTPLAGAYSPFVLHLDRADGSQRLQRIATTLPEGELAKLAGVPYCPQAALAAAAARGGRAEQADSSCPAASRIGRVDVGAGAGSQPYHVTGAVYLAGPYEGAPISLAIVTPAVAGPFDLGTVVVRAAVAVNPETARVRAVSDPLPTILQGIPLDLRSVAVTLDRPRFSLNPTSCDPLTVEGTATSVHGQSAALSSRFQVGGCSSLPFRPKLSLKVLGKTNRGATPRFRAILTAKPGEANIARAQVNLPRSEFLEQSHIKAVCTRVQFAEGDGNGSACPKGSVYGRVKAWTPLLGKPLEGPVYLRANGGERELPDLVAALNGQIDIALWGRIDRGPDQGLRSTFEVVPDAPVSRFVLEMQGGKKGLLVNSENLCAKQSQTRAIVHFVAHRGKVENLRPKLANQCHR